MEAKTKERKRHLEKKKKKITFLLAKQKNLLLFLLQSQFCVLQCLYLSACSLVASNELVPRGKGQSSSALALKCND